MKNFFFLSCLRENFPAVISNNCLSAFYFRGPQERLFDVLGMWHIKTSKVMLEMDFRGFFVKNSNNGNESLNAGQQPNHIKSHFLLITNKQMQVGGLKKSCLKESILLCIGQWSWVIYSSAGDIVLRPLRDKRQKPWLTTPELGYKLGVHPKEIQFLPLHSPKDPQSPLMAPSLKMQC